MSIVARRYSALTTEQDLWLVHNMRLLLAPLTQVLQTGRYML